MARTAGPAGESRRVLYYRNPMNASVTSPVPAKDTMGMDYVPVYADEATADAQGVRLPDSTVSKLGVRSRPVGFGPLATQIDATGIVQLNEHSVREIRLRAEGWIEELSVRAVGDTVRAGQPLFKLYSLRLESAEQEYLNSLTFNDVARVALSERRLIDLAVEPAFIASLRETRKIPHLIPFHASSAGVVTELGVRQGAYVDPTAVVMRIAALDPAWVVVDVPQSSAADVIVGNKATLSTTAYPERTFEGHVDYIYPTLDASTRTLRVRLVVPNPNALLLPNMYASAVLMGAASEPAIHVPREAVIRDGARARVILAQPGGRFVPRAVRLGREIGNELVVLDGLAQGDRVVTSAIFLVDSEASVQASLERIGGGMPAADGATGSTATMAPKH